MMNANTVSSSTMMMAARDPSREEMHAVFLMCRSNQWNSVMNCIRSNRNVATAYMVMDNHITTTILHQAITSKGDTAARARVIREILDIAPKAASIRNGYGSLPLHVIAQRNTKMDSATKELLIMELVNAWKGALISEGGVGKRTPLHIIFTDYINPRITQMMIRLGKQACFLKDKKGYLPAHVACSRHCSPEKLAMLLEANPGAIYEKNNKGETLLSLARSTATRSHPNFALIADLERRYKEAGISFEERIVTPISPDRPGSGTSSAGIGRGRKRKARSNTRTRKVTMDSITEEQVREDMGDPAALLLHFSQANHQDENIKSEEKDDDEGRKAKHQEHKKTKLKRGEAGSIGVKVKMEDVTAYAEI